MALHLIKLCVGADSIEDLREWVSERSLIAIAAGMEPHSSHITRMIPKRDRELLDGGSLYWVIKGQVQARQQLLDTVWPHNEDIELRTVDVHIRRLRASIGDPDLIRTVRAEGYSLVSDGA